MDGQRILSSAKVNTDKIYDSLLVARNYDQNVQMYLKVILPAFVQFSKKLYKEHLTGDNLTKLTSKKEV